MGIWKKKHEFGGDLTTHLRSFQVFWGSFVLLNGVSAGGTRVVWGRTRDLAEAKDASHAN